jgi:hypothetical protein
MTIEKLQEIMALASAADIVGKLSMSSYSSTIPKWNELEKQYNPMKHSIQSTTIYPPSLNESGQDDFKRTSLALQKLAVNRIAQSMFSTPVSRSYNYDRNSESQQKAVAILEELYRTQNNIDSTNIERCKRFGASCQVATIWRVYEKPNVVQGEVSKFKLAHNIYSEMDGYKLYPIIDPNGELLVFSIGYQDSDGIEYLASYFNLERPEYRLYKKEGEWAVVPEVSKPIDIFPVVYLNTSEPVWGGDTGTKIVEQLEEMESYQGLYIKRNALPTFTLDYGEVVPGKLATTREKSTDARRIIKVGKGGTMSDVTWDGAGEAVDKRYERLRNAFFEQIQVPDTSFANMISSNTSAENKELIFADAKAKARDLGGEWEKAFYNELEIVKKFASVLFSSYAKEYESISVRSIINPYSIKTKKENAEYIAIGANAMSLDTQIQILGEVDNVQAEIEAINSDRSANANQL